MLFARKYRRSSVVTFFSLVLIAFLGFVLWYFVLDPLPRSQAECLKTRTNDYSRNSLWCSYSPMSVAELWKCKNLGGQRGPICLVTYYNPSFVFPESYEECSMALNTSPPDNCDVGIERPHAYDKELAERLIQECFAHGGMTSFSGGCGKRFQP